MSNLLFSSGTLPIFGKLFANRRNLRLAAGSDYLGLRGLAERRGLDNKRYLYVPVPQYLDRLPLRSDESLLVERLHIHSLARRKTIEIPDIQHRILNLEFVRKTPF